MRSTRNTSLLLGTSASITLAACGSTNGGNAAAPSPTTDRLPIIEPAPPTDAPATPTITEPTADHSALDATDLAAILDDHHDAGEFVGARLAFRDSDGATIEVSTGTRTTDAESANVDVDIPWGAGSITKTFVAVIVMQLAEEGRLDLDAGIDAYFPDLAGSDQITPRQLLQHTSGLDDYFEREWTTAELIEVAELNGRVGQPGGEYHYSNTGFIVLGEIIEQITGESWLDEVEARIVEPLQLEHTGLIDRTAAPGYDPVDGLFVQNERLDPSIGGAAGALQSTDSDLLRYVTALFDGTLLSRESLDQMETFIPGEDLSDFGIIHSSGLGLERYQTDDITVYGHLGSSDAHSAFIGFDEKHETAVAVQVNSQAPGPQAIIAIEALSAAAGGR